MPLHQADKRPVPPALPGFNAIHRYWDPVNKNIVAKIQPGEIYVTKKGEIISTVLGSCISVCMMDVERGIAGMNHFMLPRGKGELPIKGVDGNSTRYGNWAMEFLINEMIKAGSRKETLDVKVFGGGQVLAEMEFMDIGQCNIDFVFSYLVQEGMPINRHDVGGIYPRKLLFFGDTGRVKMKKLKETRDGQISGRERSYAKSINSAPKQGDITLF
ncbi:MAG: chemoreceptor glutamine deamidase CheD [Pseudomonadales bacterium]|nr:chemoreceptor glutamine deamidase CheD [Pseudomonadales bacterium]